MRSFLGYDIKPMVATERDVLRALDRYYSVGGESVETLIAGMEQDEELLAGLELVLGHVSLQAHWRGVVEQALEGTQTVAK